jgi:hypothetical protein
MLKDLVVSPERYAEIVACESWRPPVPTNTMGAVKLLKQMSAEEKVALVTCPRCRARTSLIFVDVNGDVHQQCAKGGCAAGSLTVQKSVVRMRREYPVSKSGINWRAFSADVRRGDADAINWLQTEHPRALALIREERDREIAAVTQ